jgi:hypothetical protein
VLAAASRPCRSSAADGSREALMAGERELDFARRGRDRYSRVASATSTTLPSPLTSASPSSGSPAASAASSRSSTLGRDLDIRQRQEYE